MKITTIEDLLKARLPVEVIRDIEKRITDWMETGGSKDDPYIKQQFRYAENFLRMTRGNDLSTK